MKFLDERDVCRLRQHTAKLRKRGVRTGRLMLVRNWFIVELGLETGLRLMEIAQLQCRDLLLDLPRPEIIVRKGKGGKRRVVKVSRRFQTRAKWFLCQKQKAEESVGGDAPVIAARCTKQALCRRQIQKVFTQLVGEAKLSKRVGIHCLRHTYGSGLYRVSRDLRLVQKQLGHSRITTTEVYAEVVEEDAVEAVEKLYRR